MFLFGLNDLHHTVNNYDQPVKLTSLGEGYLFSFCELFTLLKRNKTIHMWGYDYTYLETMDKTIHVSSDVLGMEICFPYLFTRSKSQLIKFYKFDSFEERLTDNEDEIIEMCPFKKGIIAVDVKNGIR